jgi:hypothetical protein
MLTVPIELLREAVTCLHALTTCLGCILGVLVIIAVRITLFWPKR